MEVNNSDDAAGAGAGEGGDHSEAPNPNPKPNPSPSQTRVSKPKSCKGSLYYSSVRKSKSKNPTCFGISGTLHQFPSYTVGGAELGASKQGANLANFKYACLGYSIYLDNKNSSADSQNETPKLPFCVGLEMLMYKKPLTSPVGHVPDTAHKSEEHEHEHEHEHAAPQPRSYKHPHVVTGEKYFKRFKRNASVVASGVARNLSRVGNYIKETLDDIINPYRRGPK